MNETHDFGIQKDLEKSREDLTLRVKVIETDCVSSPLYIYRYPSGSSAPAYNSRVYNASNQLRWQTVQTRWNLEISRNIVHRLRSKRCLLSYTSNVEGKDRCRTRVNNTVVHFINNTFNVARKIENIYRGYRFIIETIVKWRKIQWNSKWFSRRLG